jgi:nitric oxide reductase subunit B
MKKLWLIFIAIFVFSFAVLGWVGTEIFRQAPPIPREVVSTDGQVVIPAEDILNGQNVWQAMGGMESGSIWGHGSYVAPDWSADYLHREAVFILENWSRSEFGTEYSASNSEQQAVLRQRLQNVLRKNNYDASNGRLTIEPVRVQAFEDNLRHYSQIFSTGNKEYAVHSGAQSDPVKLRQLNAFFFWTSWASVANRPNDTISYTSN